jgi:hypothetical protein
MKLSVMDGYVKAPAFTYTSGFVLGRPITRSPGLKTPRFFISSILSKRFKTFRFV